MGLFDSAMSGDQQKTPVDILDTLLSPDNVAQKTDLNISQIKVLVQLDWFRRLALPENENKEPLEILNETLIYYMSLMCSLKRKSREEIIKGLSDMKDSFMQNDLLFAQMAGKRQ